jgi:cell division protein FtsW
MLKPHWYKVDWGLLIPVVCLIIIGVVMIFSTSSIVGFSNFNDSFFFIKRHFVFLFIGVCAFFVGLLVPFNSYKKYAGVLFIAALVLLILTLSPLGVKVGGAKRWLDLVLFRFQPAEVAKFAVVVLIAIALDRKERVLNHFVKGGGPLVLIIVFPIFFLILQPDLGNSGLILMVFLGLLFLSKFPIRYIIGFLGGSVVSLVGIILSHPYQLQRIKSFLNPWEDPLGKNYHMVQSLIAIGSGGITGVGLGESKLKYFYLPLQYSDFIFSIICEEGGFILAAIVIGMYFFILVKAYLIAKKTTDTFAFSLAMGCAFLVCFQAFINIAVVLGLFPVTGIPLTFISYGGTSLITSLFYIGVILNISNSVKLKEYAIYS